MAIRKTLSAAEARIAVGRLAPRRKSAGSAGLVLRLRSPGPVPVCRLVAGGGHLYDSRGSEVPESAVLRLGLQGPSRPQELCAGTLPGHDAGRCGTGRRRRACGAGKPGGRAVSVTAPIPAVRDQAFSCPWLRGSRGARTCSGRRRPQTCLAARIRWSARLTRVEGERPVKPSAQPTLVRTQHLPLPAKTASVLRKRDPAGRFLLVALCTMVCHRVSMHSNGYGHIADSVRSERAVRITAPPDCK
jgi:hypothetical protein